MLWDVSIWLWLVCLMLHKTKIQNLRVWNKAKFIDQEGTHWENGRLRNTSNPSCSLDWIWGSKHQKGLGRGAVKVNVQGFQFPDKILTLRLGDSLGWSHTFVGGPGSHSFLQSKPANHCFMIFPPPAPLLVCMRKNKETYVKMLSTVSLRLLCDSLLVQKHVANLLSLWLGL